MIDIFHVAFCTGFKTDHRIDKLLAVEIAVHQQFPTCFFDALAAPARIVRIRLATGARKNDFRVVEMGFTPEVETF
ncbi:hypothetical protein D3C86_1952070 [compost metagenome]